MSACKVILYDYPQYQKGTKVRVTKTISALGFFLSSTPGRS